MAMLRSCKLELELLGEEQAINEAKGVDGDGVTLSAIFLVIK